MNTRTWLLTLCCLVAISGCAGTEAGAPCEDATVLDDAPADAAVA